jgi:sulfonate transport system substrate-binding protein
MNTKTISLRIGGVPEHFNLPIRLGIESAAFKNNGIDLQWNDFPGGTGEMCRALANGSMDVCVLLTEGITAAIVKGLDARIIGSYVKSPLIWGIYTGNENKLQNHSEVYDNKIAISRFGSGSHLMAIVDAMMEGKILAADQFVEVKDLNGGIASLQQGATDAFYWEKYTTKPHVLQGKIRKIGEFITPWPCFVIAARQSIIEQYPQELALTLRLIHEQADSFMKYGKAPQLVSQRYGIDLESATKWFHATEWSLDSWVYDKTIENVAYTIKVAGIIPADKIVKTEDLIWIR